MLELCARMATILGHPVEHVSERELRETTDRGTRKRSPNPSAEHSSVSHCGCSCHVAPSLIGTETTPSQR